MCKTMLMLAWLAYSGCSRRVQSSTQQPGNHPRAKTADAMNERGRLAVDLDRLLALHLLALNPEAAFNPSTSGVINGRPSLEPFEVRQLHSTKVAPRASTHAKAKLSPPPLKPKNDGSDFSAFVGTLMTAASATAQVASKAAQAAGTAADQWVNTGWQVKKKPGQIIPEIRPNSAEEKAMAVAKELSTKKVSLSLPAEPAEPAARLAPSVDSTVTSLLASDGAMKLQSEFVTFLEPREGSSYRTTQEGEIVFASEEALAQLVTEFSYGKLKEVAAATRAIARYVEDLEEELEVADDEVVNLRMELKKGAAAVSETTKRNDELQEQAFKLASELSRAQQELETRELAIAQMEKAAERTAEELLNVQKAKDENGQEARSDGAAKALRLEQELMEAEEATNDLTESKARLEESIAALNEQKEKVEEARLKEAEQVRKLEEKAREAEAKSEQMAHTLSASESQVAALQSQLDQLKRAIDVSSPDAAKNAPELRSQAVELSKKIGSQLSGTGLTGSSTRLALSKMKKIDLVTECEERGLKATGGVAELRALLRIERKRDQLIDNLIERGWSEKKARDALEAEDWNLDAAIKRLTA